MTRRTRCDWCHGQQDVRPVEHSTGLVRKTFCVQCRADWAPWWQVVTGE